MMQQKQRLSCGLLSHRVVIIFVVIVVFAVDIKELSKVIVCSCRWTTEGRISISTVQKNSADFVAT